MVATAPREIMEVIDPYVPITTPPAGLLTAAVGTPQAPLPPIDPNTYEDDDVVNQLNRITSQDSDFMQQARTSGLQTANRRGLLNTSIAGQASQAAAIAAAAPLASQNASQRANRNQERLSSFFTGERQQAGFEQDTAMQERQLTAAEQQQAREIAARLEMQGIDINSQREFQANQLASSRQLAELNIAAESERLGRQLTAAETQQIRDLASRSSLLDTELASREALTREGFNADLTRAQLGETNANLRANLDAATRTQMAELANLGDNQRAALQYYLSSNNIYAQSLDRLYENKDIPAPARDAAMQNFLALRNSGVNLPALLFGTSFNWGTGTGTGTPALPGTGTTAPGAVPGAAPPTVGLPAGTSYWNGPTREEILSMYGDKGAGGFGYPTAAAAVSAYNTWARANGVAPIVPPGGGGSSGGGLSGLLGGSFSGIGIAKSLFG